MKPSIGRIVHYKLNNSDAQDINRRRHDFMTFNRTYEGALSPGATGHVGHVGNAVRPGDVFPAMVVRVFPGNPHDVANLQVHLDGNDTLWVTSRHEGEDQGEWSWPVREPESPFIPVSEADQRAAAIQLGTEQIRAGTASVDEVRERLNLPPWDLPETSGKTYHH